jgi:hypothetical protein
MAEESKKLSWATPVLEEIPMVDTASKAGVAAENASMRPAVGPS